MTMTESKLAESAEVGICYLEFKLSGASFLANERLEEA